MDRIDLHVEVDSVSYGELVSEGQSEDSATVKSRIDKARKIQQQRFAGQSIFSNAQMSAKATKEFCKLDKKGIQLMESAFEKLQLSARARDRILRVARTIADLDGEQNILPKHLAEAVQYRSLDRKYRV